VARHSLLHDVRPDGFQFRLERPGGLLRGARAEVAFDAWKDDLHSGVSLLRLMIANGGASVLDGRVLMSHGSVASLAPAEAQVLGLPPTCPHALRLQAQGAFSDQRFAIRVTWLDQNGADVHGLIRTGASIATIVDRFIIRDPLFTLLEKVEDLNVLAGTTGKKNLDERMVRVGHVKLALEAATGDASVDRYLSRVTISHATGIGIDATASRDAPVFRPALYGDVPPSPGVSDNEDVEVERQPLLPAEQALAFRENLFPNQGAWSHYRLGEGAYVVLDTPVVAALRVVQQINAADPETRRRFRHDPNSFLLPAIEAAGGLGDILCGGSALAPDEFVDYGNRVLGVVEWEGRAFSFKIPVHQHWFPGEGAEDIYPIEVPGTEEPLVVPKSALGQLIDCVEGAMAAGETTFTHNGRSYPLHRPEELLKILGGLTGSVSPDPARRSPRPKEPHKRLVLRVAENEEDLEYLAQLRDPDGTLAADDSGDVPGMKSVADLHQRDGMGWLKACFLSGMPGALLADDMGLGKTFQVLAFLHWLRQRGGTDGRPVLLVAPAKLLEEWQEQIEIHLPPMALGRPVLAYERNLRDYKLEKGNESALGRATLDVERLRNADWIVTTYETLRDHQFSFAKVRYRIAIFDEAQKIKSGTSMLNHAAKAQQPDFVILMTGTPVENSVMDIWTLLDVAWPGFLGVSGKEFVHRYGDGSDEPRMTDLKMRLVEPQPWGEGKTSRATPPVMLRRFKSEVLRELPQKTEVALREEMPSAQARAYDAIIAEMQSGNLKPLVALQALRKVCLHPDLRLPRDAADRQALIAGSARFQVLFRILHQARDAGQGVLVFIDLRHPQMLLQTMIRDEFQLPKLPDVINGNTASEAVATIKREFQNGRGFGVLLLGPRAAGFGLTLTRATQVVHLNRWWNPAVEDQCSDRTHRKGQTKDVTVHLPIAVHPRLGDESFDVILDELLRRKRSVSRRVVVPSSMSERELAEFFSRLATGHAPTNGALADLDLKDWRNFEVWVANQFKAAGWQVNDTPGTGDGGADVIGRHPAGGRPVVIQAKHKVLGHGSVDESAVIQVAGAPQRYQTSHRWLADPILLAVSNGMFELRAHTMATQMGVQIIGRAEIAGLDAVARELFKSARRH
jgi:HJR/Mrr/RecB family endonuclease